MKNLTIITLDDKTAQVSKTFAKRAVIFGTEEYKLWREYKKDFPNAEMKTKEIKKNPNKKTYHNMTYKNIIKFIEEQDNKKELLDEMEKVRNVSSISASPYHSVVAWFEKKFENTNDYKVAFAKYAEEQKNSNTENTPPLAEENTSEKVNA